MKGATYRQFAEERRNWAEIHAARESEARAGFVILAIMAASSLAGLASGVFQTMTEPQKTPQEIKADIDHALAVIAADKSEDQAVERIAAALEAIESAADGIECGLERIADTLEHIYIMGIGAGTPESAKPEAKPEQPVDPKLETPIDSLFSTRVVNALASEGIDTIGDLLAYGRRKLLCIRNLGDLSLRQIEQDIEAMGLKWPKKPVGR